MRLEQVAMLALINTGLMIIANKWGIISWYQLHRPKFLPQDCSFCAFFWMNVIQFTLVKLLTDYGSYYYHEIFFYSLASCTLSLYFYRPRY